MRCWCGNTQLEPFSDDYLRCAQCETLVCTTLPTQALIPDQTDEAYYGRNYWLAHQETDLGQPNIINRARTDFTDRIPYWLNGVLKYCLPPASTLEIGSAHGAFVAALRQAGFDASGLELSPWMVDFSKQSFDVPIRVGPLEQQNLAPGTLDLIILLDVVEHLPDPVTTLRHVFDLLKPDGKLLIQMPAYPAPCSYSELLERQDPFLNMLIPGEHLFLYSPAAWVEFLRRMGVHQVVFEPALFKYDLFAIAAKTPFVPHAPQEIDAILTQESRGRMALALLDLHAQSRKYEYLYQKADRDRNERLDQVVELTQLLKTSETDRDARFTQIQELTALLTESEADRAARLVQNQEAKRIIEAQNRLSETQNKHIEAYKMALYKLRSKWVYRILRRLGWMKNFEAALLAINEGNPRKAVPQEAEASAPAPAQLKRIVVDLTPVRPGGENGGAKLLALELVKRFSRDIAPEVEFILFTSSDVHEELAWLDAPNVRRMCVNQIDPAQAPTQAPAPRQRSLAGKMIHAVAQTLEKVLPQDVFRKIYTRYRQEVIVPQNENLVRSLGADLIFCPFTGIYYSSPEIPLVVVVHDLQYLYYPELFLVEHCYHTDRHFRQACRTAAKLVCVSDYTRQTVIQQGQVEPERAVTIHTSLYNPLDLQPLEQVSQTLLRFNLSSENYLFYPANFWPHKNHAMLLTAFNLYRRRHPESTLKLVFTGAPGKSMEMLRTAVEHIGLRDWVVFAGFLKEKELACLFQGCLALIFPSLFEGFGVPVLEAMHFGKPVLCSQITSLPEVGGDAVLYFDPRRPEEIIAAIERIVAEPALAAELIQKGFQQAAKFNDPDRWARQYFNLLNDTFQSKRFFSNGLTGLYPDDWAGGTLDISVAAGPYQDLELEIDVPAWLPQDLKLKFVGSVVGGVQTYVVPRGQTQTLCVPLATTAGMIQLRLSPAISPKELKMSNDWRKLSCIVKRCQLISPEGSIDIKNGGSK